MNVPWINYLLGHLVKDRLSHVNWIYSYEQKTLSVTKNNHFGMTDQTYYHTEEKHLRMFV